MVIGKLIQVSFEVIIKRGIPVFFILSLFLISVGCKPKEENKPEEKEEEEQFHADNDIAMTVRSLVDAIRVGESLDSLDYDYLGILTDGEGTPLYTNLQGLPGEWVVDVVDVKTASIRNLDLGDLLAKDLEDYILECLMMDTTNRVDMTTADAEENEDTDIAVYDFEGGFLRFEIRSALAPNGLEGTLLTIILSSDLPKGVETQTAG